MSDQPSQPTLEERKKMLLLMDLEEASGVEILFKIKKLSHLLRVRIAPKNEQKITPARMRVLSLIFIKEKTNPDGEISPSDLSRELNLSRNTISAMLNILEEQALIVRELHPADRRQFLIRLSSDGQGLVEKSTPKFGQFVTSIFDVLNEDEQQQFSGYLDKLIDRVSQQLESPESES